MINRLIVPGVYEEPQRRVAAAPFARTDVAGFVGFEPRVRDGTTPCGLLGAPPTGHQFQVDVASIQVVFGRVKAQAPALRDLTLSADLGSIPIGPGAAIAYAVVVVLDERAGRWLVVQGAAGTDAAPPTDAQIQLAARAPWLRVADVVVRRTSVGNQVFPVVFPRLPPTRCDDWGDFELAFGPRTPDDDGTLLARAVWGFFANGGKRCWVTTVRRPRAGDARALADSLADMVGVPGASESEATGVERLLLVSDVAIVDVPDLYARRAGADDVSAPLPPRDVDACFRRCDTSVGLALSEVRGQRLALEPLFNDLQVANAQRSLLVRCAAERWRVLLLLTAPVEFDPADGKFHAPTPERAIAWRRNLDGAVDDLGLAVAAFYYPWLLVQDRVDGPVFELPPTPFAAGVIARRDLARGPHVAPANEVVRGVVGLARSVDDAVNAAIYDTPIQINPIRALPGMGIRVWGARTLSRDARLRYLPVRRCLSAIERRAAGALEPLVFEPNTPALWLQVTQIMMGILLPIFKAGALLGAVPAEAFYVRCDESTNPADQIENGLVLCEVGVAIAAPAEFVVFRLSRSDAAIEVAE